MANYIHSLGITVAEAQSGAPVFFPAAAGGFGLVADRAYPRKEAPAGYRLFASRAVPKGPAPGELALAIGQKPETAAAQLRRWPYRALAAAIAAHLAVAAFFIVKPGEPRRLGLETGLPDHLNVSLISSEDLRRLSSAPQEAMPPAPPQSQMTPPSPPEAQSAPPPQPSQREEIAAFTPSPSKATPTREFDAAGFIEMASSQFSAQLNQAFKAAEAQRDTHRQAQRQAEPVRPVRASANMNVTAMRPGATHMGKSDEFERAVIWALGATVPTGNGKWGTTIVTFVVSPSGQLEGLQLIKSAGDDWLDKSALMAVKQARMPVPPEALPLGDRKFVIEYISLPFRTR